MKKLVKVISLVLITAVLAGCVHVPLVSNPVDSPVPSVSEPVPLPSETETPLPLTDEQIREQLEEERKLADGEFYVPLKALEDETSKTMIDVKGLYVRGETAAQRLDDNYVRKYEAYVLSLDENDTEKTEQLLKDCSGITEFEKITGLILATKLNAVVINTKDDGGFVNIPVSAACMETACSQSGTLNNISEILAKLKGYGIYTIARIVVFKDDVLAKLPKYAIKYDSGEVWKDYSDASWVDPYDEWVQDYNICIAKECALYGFDEIQFDYVRFPEKFSQYAVSVEYLEGRIRQDELILDFLNKAHEALLPYNVNVAADVFGCVARIWDDELNIDIGQVWYNLTQAVDYICPMVYPSHYRGTTWYTYNDPNKEPYLIVKGAISDSLFINSAFKEGATVRFWLQDFEQYGYPYGPEQILDEVKALNEAGIDTYIFWNSKNIYDPYNYLVLDDTDPLIIQKDSETDLSGRTYLTTANEYLNALIQEDPYYLYILTPLNSRAEEYKVFKESMTESDICSYIIGRHEMKEGKAYIYVKIQNSEGISDDMILILAKENGIWKVESLS
ncbi:MAG: putative glycoside hydrolase [Candidatus Cloacimonetes bacterium]|nr:putative glycoside hydrolase [Candidatus Cloacimonadota bacterium]